MPINPQWATISFQTLIKNYSRLQSQVMAAVSAISETMSKATPGKFLLLQFQMSTVTQIGESISNLVSQVMASINNAIRNQKSA